MKLRANRRAGRRNRFRPQLETLENRWCPSCSVSVVDGHILQIVGDDTANRIGIVDTSAAVSVTCDDIGTSTFTGIDRIMDWSGPGDDVVSYRFEPFSTATGARPANLFVDLGSGDDTFTLAAPIGVVVPADDTATWNIDLTAGQGNDQCFVFVDKPFQIQFALNASLGAGNDIFDVNIGAGFNNPPAGRRGIHVAAGAGDDQVALRFGGMIEANLDVSADLGDGNDSFLLDARAGWQAPPEGGSSSIDVAAGAGNDQVTALFANVNANLSFTADLGAGDDAFTLLCPSDPSTPAPDPDYQPCVDVAVQGGAGADTFQTFVGQRDLSLSAPRPHLGFGMDLNYEGDGGNDTFIYDYEDVTLDGHIDAILDAGGGNDTVTSSLHNVDVRNGMAWSVNTWAGDDSVQFLFEPNRIQGEIMVNTDLGAGNDAFTLLCPSDPSLPPPVPDFQPCLDVAVQGGAGNDAVTVLLTDVRQFSGEIHFTGDLGAGDDSFALLCPVEPNTSSSPVELQPCIDVAVHGGAGADVFRTFIGSATDPISIPCPTCIAAEFLIDYEGDDGTDSFFTDVTNVGLDGSMVMSVEGGHARDTVRTMFGNVDIEAPLTLSNDGGAGDDDIRVIFGFNPQPDPPAAPGITVGAPVQVLVDGGLGEDNIAVICGFNPQPDPPAFPAFLVTKRFQLDILGGGGDDNATLAVLNSDIGGSVEPNVDMGAGDDVLSVETTNVNVSGQMTALINLRDGSDVMGWSNHDVFVSGSVVIDVAGGSGDDTLQGTYTPCIEPGGTYDLQFTGDGGNDTLAVSLLPELQRDGSFHAAFDGGAGNDNLIGLVAPGPCMPGSLVAVSLQGGGGNDHIVADVPPGPCAPGSLVAVSLQGGDGDDQIEVVVELSAFTPESGHLHVAVDGGDGSDQMVFLARGADRPMENVLLTLDGGDGEDFAIISSMVQVQNVEHVELV